MSHAGRSGRWHTSRLCRSAATYRDYLAVQVVGNRCRSGPTLRDNAPRFAFRLSVVSCPATNFNCRAKKAGSWGLAFLRLRHKAEEYPPPHAARPSTGHPPGWDGRHRSGCGSARTLPAECQPSPGIRRVWRPSVDKSRLGCDETAALAQPGGARPRELTGRSCYRAWHRVYLPNP